MPGGEQARYTVEEGADIIAFSHFGYPGVKGHAHPHLTYLGGPML
jgi:hypothetical protein